MPGNNAFRVLIVLVLIVLFPFAAFAQPASNSGVNSGATLAAPSVSEKWSYFQTETIGPFTLGAGAFNAAVSQVTRPLHAMEEIYGRPIPSASERRSRIS